MWAISVQLQLTNKRSHGEEAERSEEISSAVDGCEALQTHHVRHEQVVKAAEHPCGTPPDTHHSGLPHRLYLLGKH